MAAPEWHEIGEVPLLQQKPLQEVVVAGKKIALAYQAGQFHAISGVCNHVGGPLGQGRIEGEYVVCPWHYWKFSFKTGKGEPGFEDDAVPRYELKIEGSRLYIDLGSRTERTRKPHEPHRLARPVERADGPLRVLGISTTSMTEGHPRPSTSEFLLQNSLSHAKSALGCQTQLVRLSDLKFRSCEGFYSKSAHACTWPCSITAMDPADQLDRVYEAFVHWADVVLIATPIRWGNASALYYKMVERLNCIQNQITIANRQLIRNKTVGMIITGGQDGIQSVAGQLLSFFSEIGCTFPPFPFIAHSRGWSAEDMENNIRHVQESQELQEAARALATRAVNTASWQIESCKQQELVRAGRKAHRLEVERGTT
jgi:nitrite reductase/ring-hydroxylating ferredoxin subunit/multimeric flavodoxin WrbA